MYAYTRTLYYYVHEIIGGACIVFVFMCVEVYVQQERKRQAENFMAYCTCRRFRWIWIVRVRSKSHNSTFQKNCGTTFYFIRWRDIIRFAVTKTLIVNYPVFVGSGHHFIERHPYSQNLNAGSPKAFEQIGRMAAVKRWAVSRLATKLECRVRK